MDKTLLKGLSLLEVLARSGEARRVTDLAQESGLNKSNIHRVLKTLETAGYVRQDPKLNHYSLSLKLWELGCLVVSRIDLVREARDELTRLSVKTRETVHLSILEGDEVIYIDKIDSPQPIRAYTRIGGRAPAYAVATGKVLLAHVPEETITVIGRSMQRFTSKTVQSVRELKVELNRIRERGFAVNTGEWREAVVGIAAPIRGAQGNVEAAVGISGPANRLNSRKTRDLASEVVSAADAISIRLGYRGAARQRNAL